MNNQVIRLLSVFRMYVASICTFKPGPRRQREDREPNITVLGYLFRCFNFNFSLKKNI